MNRAEHREGGGTCPRCGLPDKVGGRCPPGFWMSSAEAERWSMLGERERERMEQRLGSQQAGDPK